MSVPSTLQVIQSKLSSNLSSVLGIQKADLGVKIHKNIAILKHAKSGIVNDDTEFVKSVDLFNCVQVGNAAAISRYIKIKGNTTLFIRKYGGFGPTLIQWAYLYKQFAIGRLLISFAPERVLDTVNSPIFLGENILHMAIIHGNIEEVKYLCMLTVDDVNNMASNFDLRNNLATRNNSQEHTGESSKSSADNKWVESARKINLGKYLVGQIASGEFFVRGTAYYFGELPLFFAAATNQIEMITTILDICFSSDDMKLQGLLQCNSYGDNLLHICVYRNNIECYKELVMLSMKLAKVKLHDGQVSVFNENKGYHLLFQTFGNAINVDGKSPLTLSAQLGYTEMFECIMSTWR